MDNGSIVCFRKVRRTAEVVKRVSALRGNDEQLTRVLCKGLLPSVELENVQIRVQVKLAVLEFQRLSGLDLNTAATLDAIAYECAEGHSALIGKALLADYNEDQMTGLIDWLIRMIGHQASINMAEQQHNKNKRHRKAQIQHLSLDFESAAVLLHCICQMSSHLSPSYFKVIALDAYVKANKDEEDVILSCCRFSSLLSLSTKIELLSCDFERRQRRQEREQMYADIYAGGNYQRGSNGQIGRALWLEVDREHILADSRKLLKEEGQSLSNGIHVRFIGEEGEDAGGLLKEWMLLLCKNLIPLVFYQGENQGAKSEMRPDCSSSDAHLMGIVIGLSIRNRIPLDISIPDYIYKHLFRPDSNTSTLDDLGQIRPALAKGLAEMLLWEEEGFTERLSLSFSYHSHHDGTTIPLLLNGDTIPVIYSNRHSYVERLCSYILQEQGQAQLQALDHGLQQVCSDLISLQLFSMVELDGLVCGQEIALDVASLRRISSIDVPSQHYDYLNDFWSVLEQANDQSILQRLLHFITANHRYPMTPSPQETIIVFHIVVLHGKEFIERLPTASTCTNTLFLPLYPTVEQLRTRLFTALHQGSIGFGLK